MAAADSVISVVNSGDLLVGVDDESIGERQHRLELLGHFLGAELDRLQFGIIGIAGEIVDFVAQRGSAADEPVLRDQGAFFLDLEDLGKNLAERAELALQFRDLLKPGRVGGILHGLEDRLLQAGLGRERCLAVLLLGRDHEVAGQRAVRDQFAVDIARQIRFRHALPVGGDARRDALKAEIGETHAGRRDRQRHGKAEHDLGAESKGRKFDESRPATPCHLHPRLHSENPAESGGVRPRPGAQT
jgi:hypothetical protein